MATLASKAATDDFLVEHYNAIVQALRGVVGVTDDGQAYIDLGETNELRIDDSTTRIRNIGGELYFEDVPTGGAWSLSRLGGEALQEELFFGDLANDGGNTATLTADLIYLQAIYVPRDISVDHFAVFDGAAGLDAICGIYDTSGTLLTDTGSFTQTSANVNKKVGFDEYALPAGTYYIAYVPDSAAGTMDMLVGSGFKTVAAGSFTLPASITIPGSGTWVNLVPCFALGTTTSVAFA